MTKRNIFIDTDMGLDMDDAFALALAAVSPEVKIVGISTCFGDVLRQAELSLKIVRSLSGSSVPVAPGIRHALLAKRDCSKDYQATQGYLPSDGIVEGVEQIHGSDLIIEKITCHPNDITLACIGPVTNVALAVLKRPEIASLVDEVVIMGGVHRHGKGWSQLPVVEYNVQSDPEALQIVLDAGWPVSLVTLDVTHQALLERNHLVQLRNSPNPLGEELASMSERWWDYIKADQSPMHDPLALATIIDQSFVDFQEANVLVERFSTLSRGQTIVQWQAGGKVRVSVGVQGDVFMTWLLARLTR